MTLLLLLSLWPSLAAALEFDPRVVVRGNYNMAKVSGVWHSISMASDDLKRIEEDGDLRVFIQTIQHLRNGSLRFNFLFKVQGECVPVDVVCKKTEKNGEYSIAYEGENKVTVPETDYQLYVTFRLQNLRNGTETQVLALYGTAPAASAGTEYRPRPPPQPPPRDLCKGDTHWVAWLGSLGSPKPSSVCCLHRVTHRAWGELAPGSACPPRS
uniref:Lipocalin/cytosolic fatty-acid binding domain-containing protein n=1 Tax=Prolemur simus TaxID=1328070 RepID=A0A8C8YYH8_PROSS